MPVWPEIIAFSGVLLGSGGIAAYLRAQGQNKSDYETALNVKFKELDDAQSRLQDRLYADIASHREEIAKHKADIDSLKRENITLQCRVLQLSQSLAAVMAERDKLSAEVIILRTRLDALETVDNREESIP